MTDEEKDAKLYELFRAHIEHEDILFNQRMTWLYAAQAFLVFPYFWTLDNQSTPSNEGLDPSLPIAIAFIGILFGVLVSASCLAAHNHITALTMQYGDLERASNDAFLPSIRSGKSVRLLGAMAPIGSIFLFPGFWCFCLCWNHHPIGCWLSIPIFVPILIGIYMIFSISTESNGAKLSNRYCQETLVVISTILGTLFGVVLGALGLMLDGMKLWGMASFLLIGFLLILVVSLRFLWKGVRDSAD